MHLTARANLTATRAVARPRKRRTSDAKSKLIFVIVERPFIWKNDDKNGGGRRRRRKKKEDEEEKGDGISSNEPNRSKSRIEPKGKALP